MSYPTEILDKDEDDGTMPKNVSELEQAVVGHRIVSAEKETVPTRWYGSQEAALVLTLDNGTRVSLANTSDCCAYTELEAFFLNPTAVDHAILGVGTTEGFTKWHIYADFGDVLELSVGWSPGNPFYYGYGFDIAVEPLEPQVMSEPVVVKWKIFFSPPSINVRRVERGTFEFSREEWYDWEEWERKEVVEQMLQDELSMRTETQWEVNE